MQSPGMPAKERVQLLKLAWDLVGSEFAGRHQQYEMFYAGAPFVVKMRMFRNYDFDRAGDWWTGRWPRRPGGVTAPLPVRGRVAGPRATTRSATARPVPLATGVTVVTTTTEDGPAGMTASAVCSLSLDPVALLVCISAASPDAQALEDSGSFAVNVLGEGQERLARRFATPDVDRFAGVALARGSAVAGAGGRDRDFECRVAERFPGGDHSIFIGRVREFGFDLDGRPLLCFGSSFAELARSEDRLLRDAWLNAV